MARSTMDDMRECLFQMQFDKGTKMLKLLKQKYPDNGELYLDLAVYKHFIEDFLESIEFVDMAMSIKGTNMYRAHIIKGLSLLHLNRLDGAKQEWTKARGLDRNKYDRWAKLYKGDLKCEWADYGYQGLEALFFINHNVAIKRLTSALELGSEDSGLYAFRAYCFSQLDRPEDAEEDIQKLFNLYPDSEIGVLLKGHASMKLGQYFAAQEAFRAVLESLTSKPDPPIILLEHLRRLMRDCEYYGRADITQLERLFAGTDHDVSILAGLLRKKNRVLLMLNDAEVRLNLAMAEYTKVHELFPSVSVGKLRCDDFVRTEPLGVKIWDQIALQKENEGRQVSALMTCQIIRRQVCFLSNLLSEVCEAIDCIEL